MADIPSFFHGAFSEKIIKLWGVRTRPGCHVWLPGICRKTVGKIFPKQFLKILFFPRFNGFNCRICRCTWTMMDYKHPVKQLHTLYAGRFQHTVQMGKHMPCNRLPTFVYQRKTNGWFIRATFTKTVLTWFFSEKKTFALLSVLPFRNYDEITYQPLPVSLFSANIPGFKWLRMLIDHITMFVLSWWW